MRTVRKLLFVTVAVLAMGCATEPEKQHQPSFVNESLAAVDWFENRTPGLRDQIDSSAAYIIYPNVSQWGIIISGGKFGRGMVNRPDGAQIGWAAINVGSVGLQAGVRGFKLLVVLKDEDTLKKFQQNKLTGSVSGVVVAADTGASGKASFTNGVAVYEGASTGLMAGVNIGLDYMRYTPLTQSK